MTSTTFDVPGTVTLAQLARRPADETPAERTIRLASKAVVAGCRLVAVDTDRAWTSRIGCTSGSVSGLVYVVDLDPEHRSCTCQGFERHGYCCHLSLAEVEVLGGPTPSPDGAMPARYVARGHEHARPMSETLEVAGIAA